MSGALPTDTAVMSAPAQETATHNRRLLARRVLLEAGFLGTLADGMLHEGFGVGLVIWLVAFAGIFVETVRREGRHLSREQFAWLGVALFFGGAFAWRDSESLLFYDFVAMGASLALLGATTAPGGRIQSILGQQLRDLFLALRTVAANGAFRIARAIGDSGFGEMQHSMRSDGRTRGVIRAIVMTVPLLLVFGLLFGAADPLFVSVLALPQFDVGVALSHVILAFVATWIVGGWLYGTLAPAERAPKAARTLGLSLGILDVTMILGGLVALFALFIGVQVGWLFGGERLVRASTGLSYAQYARRGFFELVLVSLLVLPVLVGTRAAIGAEDEPAIRRHRLLALPLLVLVGGVIASALGRMMLYVHYYGLSTDRLFASVFIGWLAIVFAWFGLTTLRGRTRDFAAGMTITGFMTLAGLNVINPEALVARANVARAPIALEVADTVATKSTTPDSSKVSPSIDYWYLTRVLDADAVPTVVGALTRPPVAPMGAVRVADVRARCDAVRLLFERWGNRTTREDWRLWNLATWRAHRVMAEEQSRLRQVTCLDTVGETPFGDREQRPRRPGEQGYVEPVTH
jgi:hypothetical protein